MNDKLLIKDGAEPSSNSISAMNLIRLYKLTNNEIYKIQVKDNTILKAKIKSCTYLFYIPYIIM